MEWYTKGAVWDTDEKGESHPREPIVYLNGAAAMEQMLNEFRSRTTVFHLTQETGGWEMDGSGEEPWFGIRFRFDTVEVEWDEFRRPAWYVLHQRGIMA